ncbi:MAG TPA: hypothetical protein VI731_09550, partial [Bacteroidia bacterium]|nr:hypothetical protein [Bacteroidia bacterium]
MRFPPLLRKLFVSRLSKLVFAILAFALAHLLTMSDGTRTAQASTKRFEKKLHEKEKQLAAELESLLALAKNKSSEQLFHERPDYYNSLLRDKGIVLLIYEGDTLKFWSDNSVAVENCMTEVCLDEPTALLKNGWFRVMRTTDPHGRSVIGLLLLKNEYSYENQYLVNSFHPDFKLPPETEIVVGNPDVANSVKSADGEYLLALKFNAYGSAEQAWWLQLINILLNSAGLILFLLFLHAESKSLEPLLGKNPALLFFIATIVLLRALTIKIQFPQSFYELPLFGPEYYGDAKSFWFRNLGDFLINALLMLYLAVVATRHLIKNPPAPSKLIWKQALYGMLLLCIPAAFTWATNHLIAGLVHNSDISFNVNNIFNLSIYSYAGFLLIALLLATFFVLADASIRIFRRYVQN